MIFVALWVNKREAGNEKMQGIAKNIADGAMAFLKAEYRVLLIYVAITAGLLAWLASSSDRSDPMVAVAFIIGSVFSGFAGFIGMKIATKANVRTTEAARTSLSKALNVSFAAEA